MSFLANLFPARLWIYVAFAGVIFALGGKTAWEVQSWRIDNIKKDHELGLAEAKERIHTAEKANQARIIGAQNAKTTRQITIKAATDSTNSTLYGLRFTANAFAAKHTGTTCHASTETATTIFNECAAALVDLAEKADTIESDRQLLIDSWPR